MINKLFILVAVMMLAACSSSNTDSGTAPVSKAVDWKTKNEIWLSNNAKRSGIISTGTGLQYQILNTGNGKRSPGPTETVIAHYEGSLINGEVFDSSYKRNKPLELPLNRVIKGWTEALQMMKPGDKWRLYVPAELGYGQRGGGPIPPSSTLIFIVELLEVKDR